MATTTIKGRIDLVNPVKLVGENRTQIQTIQVFVPGYHDGFKQVGRDQLWQLQVIGPDKITSLSLTDKLLGKIATIQCYIDSQYVEPKVEGQDGFFSVNVTIKSMEVAKGE